MDKDCQSETNPLTSVLLRRPADAFVDDSRVEAQWRTLNYVSRPRLSAAVREFEELTSRLQRLGAKPVFLPPDPTLTLDSIYVRDAAVQTAQGLVLCRMGKPERRAEPKVLERAAPELGLTIHGEIEPPGLLEGGDVAWLAPDTIAVGIGYRTNREGAQQLRRLLGMSVQEFIEVSLPHWRGPTDVFHLMSMLSPLDRDLLLVYSPLLPVPFRNRLLDRGFQLVEVPDEEFEKMACNVLTVAPRRCLALEGNPVTRRRMERAGVEVFTYRGDEISVAGGGGPTCLTRPLGRKGEGEGEGEG